MTITIEVTGDAEDRLRENAARQDRDAMRQIIADAALPVAETLLRKWEATDPLDLALARLAARTPEEIARARAEARAAILPPEPLPEGISLTEVVGGKWPGNETDEEIGNALEKLS
ncbi:MAG: hypothetical protein SFU56_01280 [Capsulimonadales bacterium]|nr:hypothetical protein [Capsulimonadales bacterium]